MKEVLGVGVVGCGNIAEFYLQTLHSYRQLALVGMTDLDQGKAQALAARFPGAVYRHLEEMLADPRIDIVLNLTVPASHYEINKACLLSSKNVYTEKPLAMTAEQAFDLVDLGQSRSVFIASAPANFLGDSQLTAWRFLTQERPDTIRLVFADIYQGRVEKWHPSPDWFYEVGPIFDIAVYALTLLTAYLGPVKRITAYSSILLPDRVTKDGRRFSIHKPDYYDVNLELASGGVIRLNANFYADSGSKHTALRFFGDLGTLYMSSEHDYNARVEYRVFRDKANYQIVPWIRAPFEGPRRVEWARGVNYFASTIRKCRYDLLDPMHAAHVVEIMEGIHKAALSQASVSVTSTFGEKQPDFESLISSF